MAGYYDLLLGLIPVVFGGLAGLLTLFGIGLMTAVPLAALGPLGLVIHGLFINTPIDTPASQPQPASEKSSSFTSAD